MKTKRISSTVFAFLVGAILATASLPLFAQFSSSLTGTVSDSTGGVIPNATVTLTNQGTQQSLVRTTSASGVYQFPSIGEGTYDLLVAANGFKNGTYQSIVIVQNTPRNFDVTIVPGGSTETVTVSANDSTILQVSDANLSSVITSEQFEKVPTYGRDPYNLLRTAPGITGDGARGSNGGAVFLPNSVGPGGSNFGIAQAENAVQISAAGQRISDNNFLLDGVNVNSLGYGGAAVVTPNIEAIGSINVTSTSFSAEDGRNTGAQIRTVTKSGSNSLHGGVNFLYDEPGLNAFNKYGGPSGQLPVRVQTKNRDFAGSIGGPIRKDKLFGFFSFEHFNLTNQSYSSQYIDTAEYRALIHSARPNSIADAIVNAKGGLPRVRSVLTQSCTAPQNLGDQCTVLPGGLDIGSPYGTAGTYVPLGLAQLGGGLDGIPDVQYVQTSAPGAATGKQFNGRGDFYLTSRDQIAATYYYTKLFNATQGQQDRPNQDVRFNPANTAATFIFLHTFGPRLLNEFRSNFTRFYENGIQDGIAGGSNFGVPFINIQNERFNGTNDVQYGIGFGTTTPAIFAENQYEVRDTVTSVFGAHTLKLGFEGRLEQDNTNQLGGSRPTYAFAGQWNFANDTPIYEGVYANPATGGAANSARYLHDHYYSLFVQHDWKATSALTLNMGLRWEYFEPLYNKGMRLNYPALGKTPGSELVDARLLPHNHLYNSQFGNFGPKVGFAYAPAMLRQKTVFRGGFALAYNRYDDVLFDPAIEDGPGIFNYGLCCGTAATDFGTPFANGQIQYGLGSSAAPGSYAPNPALKTAINANGLPANGATVEGYGAEPNLKNPYSYLFSAEIQQDLGHQFVLSVGFQGSTGRHYARLVNQNFISPNNVGTGPSTKNTPFYALYIAHSDSNQYYNALNVHATKHYNRGLSLDATYTWSKAEDQVSSGDGANGSANQTYPQSNATELGPSDFDVKHRVTALGTWDLSYYHGASWIGRAALNGWQINGIFTAHTGFPWTPVTYQINGLRTVANTNTISPVRPTSYTGSYSPTCDASAFRNGTSVKGIFGLGVVDNTTGYPPGIGRNSFRGPCYQQIDASLGKEIRLHKLVGEEGVLRVQFQAFNVFNSLNYTPFTFNTAATQLDGGSTTTTACPAAGCARFATVVPGQSTFQKPASSTAGRVIEINARISF